MPIGSKTWRISARDKNYLARTLGHIQGHTKVLHDALWTCNATFANNSTAKNARKRIFILTNDDNPCPNDNIRQMTIQKGRDLSELGIEILVAGMNSSQRGPLTTTGPVG
jgi:hypothetical protein